MKEFDFKNRSVAQSFADAGRGLWLCIKTERNMRFHTAVAAFVIFFSIALKITEGEFAAVLVVISLMISVEVINTSIEKLCDYTCKNQNRMIGNVKDIAAGAVFISAVFAVLVGVLVFFQPSRMAAAWSIVTGSPLNIAVFILILTVMYFYVSKGPVKISRFFSRMTRHKQIKNEGNNGE
jgi:diacylglycerol kinase (ATP)